MPKLVVRNLSMSLDGFVAGRDQSVDVPLGVGGEDLHEWMFATKTGRKYILGEDDGGGETGIDDDFIKHAEDGIGATVMGRNMFGPVRGPWPDDTWRGWWGDEPPYRHPVFVLTHHARDPIEMKGGTTFNFVTSGIESALQQAFDAAKGSDVRLGGGASAVQQYLRAGLVDEMQLAMVPILLGSGERLFDGPEIADRYECVEQVCSPSVTHLRFARSA